LLAGHASAQDIRIATFAAPLGHKGPGLLLRDMGRQDGQIDAILGVVTRTSPDMLLLTVVDYDRDGLAMQALADRMGFAHFFLLLPNTGMPMDLNLDGNSRVGEARDTQGFSMFSGDSGMALLSRWPIDTDAVQDLSALLWRDLPWGTLPQGPLWTQEVAAIQRLSSTGHWIVLVLTPDGPINIMPFSATPPVFDGPEDRNGLRNRDELPLWTHLLDGDLSALPQYFVILATQTLIPWTATGCGTLWPICWLISA
jgi:hypothetical protein